MKGLCFLFSFNRHTLARLLPWLTEPCQERVVDETIWHALISSLVLWQEEFAQTDFCELIFDNFLLVLTSHGNVVRHTLRLLWYVYPKMDAHKVVNVLTATQPSREVCYVPSPAPLVIIVCTVVQV